MLLNWIMLDAAAKTGDASASTTGNWTSMLMIVLIIAIFYFLMIRPQQKKQKEIRKFREALKKGDRIITAGGILGRIKEIKENTMLISVANDTTIEVDKGSIYPSAADANEQQAAKGNN
ncbi:MAG: preprotein translocase subunit YajC [Muribaculaceae bacterium]|nr:preprotein translocase subunit YajC [Muribaculaceae bacterium]